VRKPSRGPGWWCQRVPCQGHLAAGSAVNGENGGDSAGTEPQYPFERLRATATATLSQHVPGPGRLCRNCRAPWPCEAACLAEFTLGTL
jgi:hypothetical protein